MDGLNSFFPAKIALGLVVSKDSHAFFNDEPIYSFKQHHCKVKFIQFKIGLKLSANETRQQKYVLWNQEYFQIETKVKKQC